jgi:hypothetical protein
LGNRREKEKRDKKGKRLVIKRGKEWGLEGVTRRRRVTYGISSPN